MQDVLSFVNDHRIQHTQVQILLQRLNDEKDPTKLTYFGYLCLLKPYFSPQLANDLLNRDTLSRRSTLQPKLQQTQESLLLLLNELLLLSCICIAEHEELKQMLMEDYMLNVMEIS